MPHRMESSMAPTLLLHSSNNAGGSYTWGPNDRDVQASDVYADFGQVLYMCVRSRARFFSIICERNALSVADFEYNLG